MGWLDRMVHPKARNGLVLKSSRSSFDNLGNLSGRRSLSFNVEMVGRNLPIHTPKVVEDVAPGSVMLHNMAQEVQPENKKGRFRFGLPNFRIPFLSRKRAKNVNPSETLGKCISNPLPMNRNNDFNTSDKNSALLRFDTYNAAEFALKEMAVDAEFDAAEWSQPQSPMALWSGSTWDPNLFLPPVPSLGSTFICLSDEEGFHNSPRNQIQRDWLSSPEQEVDNEWRKERRSSGQRFVKRRPSSAYGAAGNSSRMDRDSASRYAAKPIYRKGIDGGSRAGVTSSVESPACADTPDTTALRYSSTTNTRPTIPSLSLKNLPPVVCEPQTCVKTNEGRVRGAFGSTIPVLEEFGNEHNKNSECAAFETPQKRNDVDRPNLATMLSSAESYTSDEFSDLDDLDLVEPSVSEKSPGQNLLREELLAPQTPQGLSAPNHLQAKSREGCIVTRWDLKEVTDEYLQCNSNKFLAPCLTAHPDEPDHATIYPASVSSEEADHSQDEHTLVDFPRCLNNKSKRTVLDILEHREALKRKEVLCRISCQRSLIRRMKSQVHKSKVAFDRLRQGLGPQLTEKVEKLRQRWGSGRRIRRQQKLEKIKTQEEEDLWDLHFNEVDRVFASDSESWVTDDGEMIDC